MSQDASRIGKLILVPAVITLAVTLLRLVGELQGWSPTLFNRGDKPFSPSLVGIVWLVPVFGAWFGWKLTRAGSGPASLGRAFGLTLASMAVLPLFSFLAYSRPTRKRWPQSTRTGSSGFLKQLPN